MELEGVWQGFVPGTAILARKTTNIRKVQKNEHWKLQPVANIAEKVDECS
jgi:hypothetical protein